MGLFLNRKYQKTKVFFIFLSISNFLIIKKYIYIVNIKSFLNLNFIINLIKVQTPKD